MPALDLEAISAELNAGNVMSKPMLDKLRQFSLSDRETISRRTGTITVYFDSEVTAVREAEEQAAFRAMPSGYEISQLNGLNIGCGNRTIHPALLGIDISRHALLAEGGHGAASPHAMLALSHELPFASESIDYIVALHVLEHMDNPVEIIRHWLSKLKPGGGIGLVLPDWRYTWDARQDEASYGHKWNSEPELVIKLWREHLADACLLEEIETYPFKLSFDVIFRKPGEFQPFHLPTGSHAESGASRFRRSAFLSLGSPAIIE